MRTAKITIYKFSELSGSAKDRAKYDYMAAFGFESGDEYLTSLKALASHFGGKLSDWSIDWFESSHSSARFEMPDDMERGEIQRRLRQLGTFNRRTLKGNGECKLTGYCADEDAIDGFRIAFHGGATELMQLMESAFRSLLRAGQKDCVDFYSDETFSEHSDANDMEYTKDGRAHRD